MFLPRSARILRRAPGGPNPQTGRGALGGESPHRCSSGRCRKINSRAGMAKARLCCDWSVGGRANRRKGLSRNNPANPSPDRGSPVVQEFRGIATVTVPDCVSVTEQ